MKAERLLKVIEGPHVSEKAQSTHEYQQLILKVRKDANKIELKAAVEHLFNVRVRSVRVCNVKPKAKRFGQIEGRLKSWKKAYVTLEKGSEVDFSQQLA